jgi:FAD/FMN-containing dehydrogenase
VPKKRDTDSNAGTYGIVTSAIVKAHPQLNLTIASFTFTTGNTTSTTPGPSVTVADTETFWKGFNQVFAFGIPTVDAGGYLWTNGLPAGNGGFQMQVRVQMPGFTPAEVADFVQPLVEALNNLGIPIAITTPSTVVYSRQTGSRGFTPINGYFASRLFPRRSFEDPALFDATMKAARATVEAGYTFHGLNMAPTLKVAGYPAPAGVNPVWRDTVMHADVFSSVNMGALTPAEGLAEQQRLNGYMDALRAATPGGGAYFNEADVLEPNWQTSFFGSNYDKLVRIKRERDPWHVFWAPTTPGSEEWAVQTPNELPTQNGRLCRV